MLQVKSIMALLPLVYEGVKHLRRDALHNGKISKVDKTQERLGTLEHLTVKLEKKVKSVQDAVETTKRQLMLLAFINLAFVITVLLKVFGVC